MSVLESSNLRDLLRVRDDDDGRDALAGLTLAAVLGVDSLPKRPSRTLLEIIKDEESGAAYKGLRPPTDGSKKTWKSFRNRLRVRRTGLAFSSSSSSNPVNACDFIVDECDLRISNPVLIERRGVSINSNLLNSRNLNEVSFSESNSSSVGQANTSSRAQEELRPEGEESGSSSVNEQRLASAMGLRSNQDSEVQRPGRGMRLNSIREERSAIENALISSEDHREDGQNEGTVVRAMTEEVTAAAPRVSLMALLEETDWNAGELVEALEMETDEADEGQVDENDEGGNEGGEYVCCVCMVRHKGAAFIPCGHTFCRLCSRELWVNRGNCPLCNGYILEILDIF